MSEVKAVEVRNLIDVAKATLVAKPKLSKDSVKAVEPVDPVLMNELLARRGDVYDQIRLLKAELESIDAIVRDVIGSADELQVHGATVATIARWRETSLITDVVKVSFPVAEFPELYKKTAKTRLTIR